jgi:hypothetical protein
MTITYSLGTGKEQNGLLPSAEHLSATLWQRGNIGFNRA